MKVSSIAPWYGAKRTIGPRIVEELGEHRAYWEPFCGSMAVLFAKPESAHETVNDLHGDLVNLAWVLQSPRWTELYDRCARSFITEAMFLEAARRVGEKSIAFEPTKTVTDTSVERAYWFFVRSWWGRNGTVGARGVGDSLAVRFTPGGGHGGVRFRSCTDSMPEWHERLRCVVVLNRNAFDIIGAIQDVDGTVIYCDPPYLVKGTKYVHDFETGDHVRLAQILRNFQKARVVVSYYAHPKLAELYPEWTVVKVPVTKGLVNQGKRDKAGAVEAPEVLLINGPSFTAEATERRPKELFA